MYLSVNVSTSPRGAPPSATAAPADSRRLRRILINLATNGVRYNRPGDWVRVTAEDGVVRVDDSGPGIPDELTERLFVPFDRFGADTGPEPGAGLGMVLARGLAEPWAGA